MARVTLRQIAMEILYKYGELKGGGIGGMMALDYSTASQVGKGSRERLKRIRSSRDLGEVRGKFVKNKDLTLSIFAVAYILLLNLKSPSEGLSTVSRKNCRE
jgi:hypothetical protein